MLAPAAAAVGRGPTRMRPWSSSSTIVAAETTRGSCEAVRTERPAAVSSVSTRTTRSTEDSSCCEVGSSSSSNGAELIRARARAARCRSPPERSCTGWSSSRVSASRSASSSTVGLAGDSSATAGPRMPAVSCRFSRTVSASSMAGRWGSSASHRRRCSARAPRERPSHGPSPTVTVPARGGSSPASTEIRVDLPEPDGPVMAVHVHGPQSEVESVEDRPVAVARRQTGRRWRAPRTRVARGPAATVTAGRARVRPELEARATDRYRCGAPPAAGPGRARGVARAAPGSTPGCPAAARPRRSPVATVRRLVRRGSVRPGRWMRPPAGRG